MRQHVNPLSRFFQVPLRLPLPAQLFLNPNLPIHLDIGSARGNFLLDLAETQANRNFVGVEIRHPLVVSANQDVERRELKNIRFLFCNANVSLQGWLCDMPSHLIQNVSIQFPDPWFKRKHHKRRVLQPSLLKSLAGAMSPGSELFLQSDFLGVINPMIDLIENSSYFDRLIVNNRSWLKANPYPIKTEREKYAIKNGLYVYRALYHRNHTNLSMIES